MPHPLLSLHNHTSPSSPCFIPLTARIPGVAPRPAATIQLCCSPSSCHVYHITAAGIPESLRALLCDPCVLKVGATPVCNHKVVWCAPSRATAFCRTVCCGALHCTWQQLMLCLESTALSDRMVHAAEQMPMTCISSCRTGCFDALQHCVCLLLLLTVAPDPVLLAAMHAQLIHVLAVMPSLVVTHKQAVRFRSASV